eukprot:TRINITY_DN2991_c0_g1_i2.p1 TRINITY_DN2991_c0_g1~~TRINITY_DN2991_c0_g1_i2.p1  ORF type:complete len:599 (-),score=137.01 TRINITY_DN2991_c0_g1_i2:30-1826(-)
MVPAFSLDVYSQFLKELDKCYNGKSDKIQQACKKLSDLRSQQEKKFDFYNDLQMKKLLSLQKKVRGRIELTDQPRTIIIEGQLTLIETDPISGKLVKSSKPVLRHMVLFNDTLLITVPYRRQEYAVERFLPLSGVVASSYDKSESNDVFKLETLGYVYYFGCTDQIERDLWVNSLQRATTDAERQVAKQYSVLLPISTNTPITSTSELPPYRKETRRLQNDLDESSPRSLEGSSPPSPALSLSESKSLPSSYDNSSKLTSRSTRAVTNWRRGRVKSPDLIRQSMNVSSSTHLTVEIYSKYNKNNEKFEDVAPADSFPYFVGTSGAIIGRNVSQGDGKGQIQITNDHGMSRMHAEIEYNFEHQCFNLRDLGSANNTFIIKSYDVDGKKISNKPIGEKSKPGPWFLLKEGTVFQVGGTRFKVTKIVIAKVSVDPLYNSRNPSNSSTTPTSSPITPSSYDTSSLPTSGSSIAEEDIPQPSPPSQSSINNSYEVPTSSPRNTEEQHLHHILDEPKRLVVVLRRGQKQRVVGAVLVEKGQSFRHIRDKIFEGLLRPNKSGKMLNENNMSLSLNGTNPIIDSELDTPVYDSVESTDQFFVDINL